jgi:hypothetical protein
VAPYQSWGVYEMNTEVPSFPPRRSPLARVPRIVAIVIVQRGGPPQQDDARLAGLAKRIDRSCSTDVRVAQHALMQVGIVGNCEHGLGALPASVPRTRVRRPPAGRASRDAESRSKCAHNSVDSRYPSANAIQLEPRRPLCGVGERPIDAAADPHEPSRNFG